LAAIARFSASGRVSVTLGIYNSMFSCDTLDGGTKTSLKQPPLIVVVPTALPLAETLSVPPLLLIVTPKRTFRRGTPLPALEKPIVRLWPLLAGPVPGQ
jgi:hypothetical protein